MAWAGRATSERRPAACALVIAAALGICAPAGGAPVDPDAERARSHFEAGQALYELGRYDEAVREFSASYTLSHHAALILNIGSCYRKLGDLSAARDVFKKFLAEAPPRDPYRPQVESILREIDATLAARAPAPPPAPAPAPVTVTAPPAQVATAPPRRSFARRHWWIFPVVGAVAVGAAVGIYFGVRGASSPDCGSATLGCLYPR
jgi:tetratricopeptide (TPR) repeat protein